MKKMLFIICIVLFFSGCSDPSGQRKTSKLKSSNVVTVEGCEYFVVDAYTSYTYIHKGNCTNPIHYENRTDESNK